VKFGPIFSPRHGSSVLGSHESIPMYSLVNSWIELCDTYFLNESLLIGMDKSSKPPDIGSWKTDFPVSARNRIRSALVYISAALSAEWRVVIYKRTKYKLAG